MIITQPKAVITANKLVVDNLMYGDSYLRNLSGLLLLSMYIFARALCVAGSCTPSCTLISSQGNNSFSLQKYRYKAQFMKTGI